jgi:hypothetical protein
MALGFVVAWWGARRGVRAYAHWAVQWITIALWRDPERRLAGLREVAPACLVSASGRVTGYGLLASPGAAGRPKLRPGVASEL